MRKIRTHIKGLYILKGKKYSYSMGWLREVFKRNYFDKNSCQYSDEILKTFNKLKLGAHKADLFRYCYL